MGQLQFGGIGDYQLGVLNSPPQSQGNYGIRHRFGDFADTGIPAVANQTVLLVARFVLLDRVDLFVNPGPTEPSTPDASLTKGSFINLFFRISHAGNTNFPYSMDEIIYGDSYSDVVEGRQVVDVDIKPQSCPNPLNTKSKGRLPVAILGTSDFDANDVDVSTVQLEGVSPLRSNIEDVSTPVANPQDQCDCTTDSADGFDDLTLKFDTQDIVAALGPVNDGDEIVLTLTGELSDGTPIEGQDCVIINKGGKAKKAEAETEGSAPDSYALLQNHPNPFNPTTNIGFTLPESGFVTLSIYNSLGEEVAVLVNHQMSAGSFNIPFDASGFTSGIYLYRIIVKNFVSVKKMILLK